MNADKNKNEENPPKVKKISFALAHEILGHMKEDLTIATANLLGYEIIRRPLHLFEVYTAGKAKHKKITKVNKHVSATKSNDRVFWDIPMITKLNNGKKLTLSKNT